MRKIYAQHIPPTSAHDVGPPVEGTRGTRGESNGKKARVVGTHTAAMSGPGHGDLTGTSHGQALGPEGSLWGVLENPGEGAG